VPGWAHSPKQEPAPQPPALMLPPRALERPWPAPTPRCPLGDLAEQLIHRHDVAFIDCALRQHARRERRHLDGDLVGLQLHEVVAFGDLITLVLEPPRDRRFDDRLAELRNLDCSHECAVSDETGDNLGRLSRPVDAA